MRIFILKIVVFCTLLASAYLLMVHKLSEGYVDMYYPKFTQKAGSLVIGLSRADEGIDPETILNNLPEKSDQSLVNFASNQNYYGKVYMDAIKEKLDDSAENRFFILSISPGSFTAPKGFGTKGIEAMDTKTPIGKTFDFTSNPNYSYIMNCYGSGLYNAFLDVDSADNLTSHDNGWNEISLKSNTFTITKDLMFDWKRQNLAYFERRLPKEEVKTYRLEWFGKTIEYLKNKGTVFLVRMPADEEIVSFENEHLPTFNAMVDSVAKVYKVPYLDYSESRPGFGTYDGSHLYSETAKEFSTILAKDMSPFLNN
ncbi:MAG: hypothetical protein KDD31_11120 [Muricauda sp.]|nr:hypothetical protein [Allomuricauda sp.]